MAPARRSARVLQIATTRGISTYVVSHCRPGGGSRTGTRTPPRVTPPSPPAHTVSLTLCGLTRAKVVSCRLTHANSSDKANLGIEEGTVHCTDACSGRLHHGTSWKPSGGARPPLTPPASRTSPRLWTTQRCESGAPWAAGMLRYPCQTCPLSVYFHYALL